VIPLQIGFSPCPNDTYIMAALAQDRLDSPLIFVPVIEDVETLNQWALEEKLEATKLSFAALGRVRNAYGLLYSGGALGRGCGPLLVGKPGRSLADVAQSVIAAPGELTTACLLLGLYLGKSPQFKHMLFSDIMPAVAEGTADFGLIIHEGRFTFHQYGLEALLDLGAWWEQETGSPIPLGGIAIRRDLGREIAEIVDRAIYQSLQSAHGNPAGVMPYVLSHAQEMDATVVQQHIQLYVNSFSFHLGAEGVEAVDTLFSRAEAADLIPSSNLSVMAY
jgi:1,4-dihydroxy-6-naphthoate synthase